MGFCPLLMTKNSGRGGRSQRTSYFCPISYLRIWMPSPWPAERGKEVSGAASRQLVGYPAMHVDTTRSASLHLPSRKDGAGVFYVSLAGRHAHSTGLYGERQWAHALMGMCEASAILASSPAITSSCCRRKKVPSLRRRRTSSVSPGERECCSTRESVEDGPSECRGYAEAVGLLLHQPCVRVL
jgi:hypothetical protein